MDTTSKKSISFIKLLDDKNSFMILNPSKKESVENFTPLPSYSELGLPLNSVDDDESNVKNNFVEIIPFECSCGKELGIYLRVISILSLMPEESGVSSFNDVITKACPTLGGCCRMKILAPLISSVISIDVNAKVIDRYEETEVEKGAMKWPSYKMI